MAKRRSGQNWDDDRNANHANNGDSRGNSRGNNQNNQSNQPNDEEYFRDMLREAQALQQDGRIDEAIELCEEIVATYGRSEARYLLAWMYQEEHIWDGAIEHYTALLDDIEFSLSCYFALGQCYRAKGDLKTAVSYFDEAVDRVNLDALQHDEAVQLIQLCHEAAKTHDDLNDVEGADTVYNALLGFLRSRGWQDHVAEVDQLMSKRRPGGGPSASIPPTPAVSPRTGLTPVVPPVAPAPGQDFLYESSRGNNGQQPSNPILNPAASIAQFAPAASLPANAGIAPGLGGIGGGVAGMGALTNNLGRMTTANPPLLPEPQRTQVIKAMRDVESYISHGLYTAAIEECLRIIDIAPQYLDVHQAMAEIFVQQNKIDQAITKYAVLIDKFLVTGRIDDAIGAYRRILQLEPNNLTYRVRLINLLSQHNRSDDMLRERVAAADSYLRLGYPDRAIEQFEQALVASPANLMLRQNYALALVRAGKVNQGIGELQRILQIEPNNMLALSRWQIALCTSAGSLSSAGGLAASGLRMMPGDGSTRVAAVEILGRLVRALRSENMFGYDEVLHEYQGAIETSPTNGDLRFALAVIYHAGNRNQEALSSYQSAMTTAGLEVLCHAGAGQVLLHLNDTMSAGMAVREFEEAGAIARRTPISPSLWSARPRLDGEEPVAPDIEIAQMASRAYHRANGGSTGTQPSQPKNAIPLTPQGQSRSQGAVTDEIYRTINEISARHPNDSAGTLQEMVQLVRHYRSQRQYEQAVIVLNEITRIAPEDASVRAELADIHINRGLLDEGIEEMRRVTEIHKRHGQINDASQVLQQIGEIQWQMGQYDEAMQTLKQTLNLTPDDMATRMLYVQYCLERGQRKEAAEQQTLLARYYYHSHQTKEAVAMLQQLIALDKDNYEAYDLLGQTYFSVGELDQAQRVYRHLAKINPTSVIARERLAQIQEMRARR